MKLVNARVSRRLGEHKFSIPAGFFVFALYLQGIKQLNIPSKLYTTIFTDPSESGKYVRNCTKKHSPRTWSKISKQLFEMGYSFPELNETISGQFPTGLIDVYEATSID